MLRGNKTEVLHQTPAARIETGGANRRVGWLVVGASALASLVAAGMLMQSHRTEMPGPGLKEETTMERTATEQTAAEQSLNSNSLQQQPGTLELKQSSTEVELLLKKCFGYIQARRLTSGVGDNAPDCYRQILALEPNNVEALAGLKRVEQERRSEGKRTERQPYGRQPE